MARPRDTFPDGKLARRLHNFNNFISAPLWCATAAAASQHVFQRNTFDNT